MNIKGKHILSKGFFKPTRLIVGLFALVVITLGMVMLPEITMISGVNIVRADDTHALSFKRVPSYGGHTNPADDFIRVSSEAGATIAITASANPEYAFYCWEGYDTGGNLAVTSYSPSTVLFTSCMAEARAYFVKKDTTGIVVSTADESQGSVSGTRYWDSASAGSYFTISATPKENYRFDYWKLNGKKIENSSASMQVRMPDIYKEVIGSDGHVIQCQSRYEAVFTRDSENDHGLQVICLSDDGSSANTATPSYTTYKAMSSGSVAITAKPGTGYSFVKWQDNNGNILGTNLTYTYNRPYDYSKRDTNDVIYAYFSKDYPGAITTAVKTKNSDGSIISNVGGSVNLSSISPDQVETKNVTLEATPKAGYRFSHWEFESGLKIYCNDDLTSKTIHFSMPNKGQMALAHDKQIISYFTTGVDVNVAVSGEGGQVQTNKVSLNDTDRTATIIATPSAGYKFKDWTVSYRTTSGIQKTLMYATATTQIDIPYDYDSGAISCIARFERDGSQRGIEGLEKNVDASQANTGGYVTPDFTPYSGHVGTNITLTANCYSGYELSHWVVDAPLEVVGGNIGRQGETNPTATRTITIKIPENVDQDNNLNVTAYFREDRNRGIDTWVFEGGSVTPASITWTTENRGMAANITATPNAGYKFSHWDKIDENDVLYTNYSTLPTLSVLMPFERPEYDIIYIAYFDKITYDNGISTQAGDSGGGSTSPTFIAWSEESKAKSYTITATPEKGYDFVKWTKIDVGSTTPVDVPNGHTASISVEMPENNPGGIIRYVAEFEKIKYGESGIVSYGGEGGDTSPLFTPCNDETKGKSFNITATPEKGYEFVKWSMLDEDGCYIDEYAKTQTISVYMPDLNNEEYIEYVASFQKVTYDDGIITLGSEGGETTPLFTAWSDETKAKSITITATAKKGYEFDSWTLILPNGEEDDDYSKNPTISVYMPEEKPEGCYVYLAKFVKNSEKTKNKEIHVEGHETSITKEKFLKKWKTWCEPVLKYVRTTIQNMAAVHTANDKAVYDANAPKTGSGSSVAASLENKIDANNNMKHSQSVDNPAFTASDTFSISDVSGLKVVYEETDRSGADDAVRLAVEEKFGPLYEGKCTNYGKLHFEYEDGKVIALGDEKAEEDATVIISGIDTFDANGWLLIYKDSANTEFIITPVKDAEGVVRFTLPDRKGGEINLAKINYVKK